MGKTECHGCDQATFVRLFVCSFVRLVLGSWFLVFGIVRLFSLFLVVGS